jgi:hypothetical protein
MVAGWDEVDGVALKGSGNLLEQRHSRVAPSPHDSRESVLPALGELDRQLPLLVAQHVNAKAATGLQVMNNLGAMIDANKDQGRIQRHTGKGADGDTIRFAIATLQGRDGYTRRKLTASGPEALPIKMHGIHRSFSSMRFQIRRYQEATVSTE